MKAYIISNSKDGMANVRGVYDLVTEEGEVLATHRCSNKEYAMEDLYSNRPERIKKWTERFGELTVDYLGCDDMTMEKILELNHKWWREQEEATKND